MGWNEVKFRKQWQINPRERIHSTKKGKKGYDRNEWKKQDKNGRDADGYRD
jgi:hypothetical protein